VTGADVSAPMLEVARAKPHTADMAPIEYVECPAQRLAVPDEAFDLATCQYAFQLLPDREGAAAEMHRVLKPGGRLAIATWITRGPMPMEGLNRRLAVLGVEVERSGNFGSRAEDLHELLPKAGFRAVDAQRKTLEMVWEGGVDQLIAALPASATWAAAQQLTPEQRDGVIAAFREELQPLERDGILRYPRESWITTARK
jgi:SAM-dependent methyltransferase